MILQFLMILQVIFNLGMSVLVIEKSHNQEASAPKEAKATTYLSQRWEVNYTTPNYQISRP